jgi:hypothetical protein
VTLPLNEKPVIDDHNKEFIALFKRCTLYRFISGNGGLWRQAIKVIKWEHQAGWVGVGRGRCGGGGERGLQLGLYCCSRLKLSPMGEEGGVAAMPLKLHRFHWTGRNVRGVEMSRDECCGELPHPHRLLSPLPSNRLAILNGTVSRNFDPVAFFIKNLTDYPSEIFFILVFMLSHKAAERSLL